MWVTEQMYNHAVAEQRELERQCAKEGGFLLTDWRVSRMRSLGATIDEFEDQWADAELAKAGL